MSLMTSTIDLPVPMMTSSVLSGVTSLPSLDDDTADYLDWEDDEHCNSVTSGLYEMYESGELLDITLQAEDGGEGIKCHRCVLAACSPYFKAMFAGGLRESREDSVRILGVDREALEILVKYAYTGQVRVTRNNAQSLLSGAALLQLPSVRATSARFMQTQLHAHNCVAIHFFASLHGCMELAERARDYIDKHFVDVSLGEEFLQIPSDELLQVLSSSELNVEKEELVYEALMRWVKHDCGSRREQLGELLPCIRLGLIGGTYLLQHVIDEPLLKSEPSCRQVLRDLRLFEAGSKAYDGDTEFSMVLRAGMIKPESCILFLGGVDSCRPPINCYNPLTRETYLMSPVGEAQSISIAENECSNDVPDCSQYKGKLELEDPATVVTDDNQIFVAGGSCMPRAVWESSALSDDSLEDEETTNVRKELFQYDHDRNSWIQKSPMLFPKSNFAIAQLGSKLYSFGGLTLQQQPMEMVECYDIGLNRWTYAGMMPNCLVDHQALSVGPFVYVLGGRAGVGTHNALMRFEPRKSEFVSLAGMPTPRFNFGACSVDGEIWVAGGQIYSHTAQAIQRLPLASVEIYNIARNQWRLGPPLPQPLAGAGLCLVRGTLHAAGSAQKQRSHYRVHRSTVVYRLDSARCKWHLLEADLSDLREYRCVAVKLHTRKLSQVFRPDVDT